MSFKTFLGLALLLWTTQYMRAQEIDDLFTTPDETIEEAQESDENTDDIDDLFSIPDETTDSESTNDSDASQSEESDSTQTNNDSQESEGSIDFTSILQDLGPEIRGSVSLNGGVVAGFQDWNFTIADDGSEHVSAYYSLGLGLNLSVRISPELRAFATFSVGINENTPTLENSNNLDLFTTPEENISAIIGPLTVGEVFIDYTLLNAVFFRVGLQNIQWGQGLLSNAGIVNPGANPSFKVFVPLGNNGLTLFAYPNGADTNLLNFAYAGLFEFILGPFSFGTSIRFHRILAHALATDIYIKTAFLGIDFTVEARLDIDTDPLTFVNNQPPSDNQDPSLEPQFFLTSNFFWESVELGLQLFGEYQFAYGPFATEFGRSEMAEMGTHLIGLGFRLSRLFPGAWNPTIRWLHQINENSGLVSISIGGPIAPFLDISFAIPMIYGPENGLFWRNNPDPNDRIFSLIIELSITGAF